MTSSARLGTAAAALLAVSGCAFSGIDLVRDTRLSLTGPKDGATVTVPFRIASFTIEGGRYGTVWAVPLLLFLLGWAIRSLGACDLRTFGSTSGGAHG